MTKKIELSGSELKLEDIRRIALGIEVTIAQAAQKKIKQSRDFVQRKAMGETAVYGVNTGFGYFSRKKVSKKDLEQLQVNLLRSHASGYGDPLSIPEVRLAMVLRLNVLVKGYTGIRYELCEALLRLIENEIYPVIPEYGSVGASGDLAPLAHLALPLIGEGEVFYRGERLQAEEALRQAALQPISLQEKEGISLINGTQIMLAVGGLALSEAGQIAKLANLVAALSFEGLGGITKALYSGLHEVRGQVGQIMVAQEISDLLEGSYLWKEEEHSRVQDPYSLRCTPQIHGPSHDALNYSSQIIERELNAATDNPLVFADVEQILSGGNFHGQALAMAFDFASIAISELANVSERRLELLLNPNSSGLHAFLAPKEGLESGYMAAQYLSASLVNENKLLANPSCTDSIPGNVGVEDHVSMGMTSARKLKRLVKNVKVVLAVECLAAVQAIDLRKAAPLGKGTSALYQAIREKVPKLEADRVIANDVADAVSVLEAYLANRGEGK